MIATNLRCERLQDPLGIDATAPMLSWICEGGVFQSACQVVARNAAGAIVWDSGEVQQSEMELAWGGGRLRSRAALSGCVRLWDEGGAAGAWSDTATFEIGLLGASDWTAKWISGDYAPNKKKRHPVDCFEKTFSAAPVARARLYVTACGLYEAHINGRRVGDVVLAPGITDYRRRIQYQTYDVTELMRQGDNILDVQLADGWYRGSCGAWGLRNQYGTQTKLLAQLEITSTNGTVERIVTDGTWSWSNDGPIRFADNKDGEVVDARMEPSRSGRPRVVSHPVVPSTSNNVLVCEHEAFSPTLVITPSGKTVLDFGQNIAGYVSFSLKARTGQHVFLRFGEMLDESGEFTQKNIQCSNDKITTPLQQVCYTCREGRNDYKTRFAIFGFQYVLVETDVPFSPEDFVAHAVYSSLERTGWFSSSNELLNRLFESTVWSAKNNSCDLPTDCPTRERHGWTGDAQIFCSTASYLFDYDTLARKFVRDMYDLQKKNGCLPQIAPAGGIDFYMKCMDGSVGWADAGVIIPCVLWRRYGDVSVIRDNYEGMARYARFMQRRCGVWYPTAKRTGLHGDDRRYLSNAGQAYGEWAEPTDVHEMIWKDCVVTHPEVGTAYTSYVMTLMSQIAEALGHTEDASEFSRYAEGTRASYQALVHKCARYSLDTDHQARLVRPLYFGLLDKGDEAYARERLVKALDNYGWRLGTGFLSTPLILYVLSSFDLDAAYRLLENEEMPGWLFMPKSGATTIWEGWEGPGATTGITSLDHYSKGAVVSWLFEVMCGINVTGSRSFRIAPRPGGSFTHAEARYASAYGEVLSSWRREGDVTTYTVSIPANCTATVALPGRASVRQGPGEKAYAVKTAQEEAPWTSTR